MADCDMCSAEKKERGLKYVQAEQAKFSIFYERDGKVVMQELCSACLKRTMLIIVRDLKGDLKVVIKCLTS